MINFSYYLIVACYFEMIQVNSSPTCKSISQRIALKFTKAMRNKYYNERDRWRCDACRFECNRAILFTYQRDELLLYA